VKKDAQPQPADERIPSPPRHDSSTLLNDVFTELRSLRAHFDDRLDRIDTHFKEMDIRIDQLTDDMSYIRRCFDLPANP